MSNIIDELLLLSSVRTEEVVVEPVLDMAEIVNEAQDRLTYMIEEYQAEFIVPTQWPAVLGYGPWIEEVWMNYLSNAIKYGGQPRWYTESCVKKREPVSYKVTTPKKGGYDDSQVGEYSRKHV